ncbi:hypothetical protein EAF00_000904 [Botryotinia globosa]|nr:hypothetical protein EAF00_000904 [Botryotinia globosa]
MQLEVWITYHFLKLEVSFPPLIFKFPVECAYLELFSTYYHILLKSLILHEILDYSQVPHPISIFEPGRMTLPSDYYAVLGVPSTATQQQIRNAYKKAALKTHPDRVASDSPERAERTRKFQQINDAYYTLSEPTRRRDYDAARTYHGFGSGASTASTSMDDDEEIPDPSAGPGGFPWSSFGFSSKAKNPEEEEKFQDAQFGDVFEEMLREEGMAENNNSPTGKLWSMVGGLSGGAMGFIVANFPGMLAGAVAGNRLGAVRDAKGKSVYSVFQELPQGDKARLLSQLAAKVFSHAVGS